MFWARPRPDAARGHQRGMSLFRMSLRTVLVLARSSVFPYHNAVTLRCGALPLVAGLLRGRAWAVTGVGVPQPAVWRPAVV